VVARCGGQHLRTTVVLVHEGRDEETVMTMHYPNPALEAELAYRREQLRGSARRVGRRHWTSVRREVG
jgi:hypothetical protein